MRKVRALRFIACSGYERPARNASAGLTGYRTRGLQRGVDGLALEREDGEDALVNAVERLPRHEPVEGLHAEGEFCKTLVFEGFGKPHQPIISHSCASAGGWRRTPRH